MRVHGKLVLSPEYFNEAIFHSVVQTFSFLNEINRFLFAVYSAWYIAVQRVGEQRPFLALLSVLLTIFSYILLLLSSACTNKGGARLCVWTQLK